MKKLLFFLLIMVAGFTGWAQPGNPNNLIIHGNVKNISDGNPIRGHAVFVTRLSSGPAYSEVRFTDSLGFYRFEIPGGSQIGPNLEFKVSTFDCDSVEHSQIVSNNQGTVDVRKVDFELCAPILPLCNAHFTFLINPANPLQVKFQNESRGIALSYRWTIGGDVFSELKDPVLNLQHAGNYLVCLRVNSESPVQCVDEVCESIQVVLPPADCHAEFQVNYIPEQNAYRGKPNHPISNQHTFVWTVGDSSIHGYNPVLPLNPGLNLVCLTVSSDSNCVQTWCDTVFVPAEPCDARFFAQASSANPMRMIFTNNSLGRDIPGAESFWSFGDGTSGNTKNAEHTYENPGAYMVCLYLNTPECSDTICQLIQVGPAPGGCDARFEILPSTAIQNRFFFQNRSIGVDSSGMQVKWVFGDGSPAVTTFNAEHTYLQPGTYTVCLYIEKAGCSDHQCKTIVVQGNPMACNADFQWNRLVNENPYKIAFHSLNGSGMNLQHSWQFSNTQRSELPNPVFTFPGPGTYEVCHTVFNPAGFCRDTVCKLIVLLPLPNDTLNCHAKFVWFTGDLNPMRVHFKNQSSPGQYHWSFGDSTFSNQIQPDHLYTSPGSYQVCLRVERPGCSDVYCTDVNVAPGDTGGFTVGGRIFAGANSADVAKVNLIRRDPVSQALYVFRTTMVDSFGFYSFPGVPSGIYLIRAGLLPASAYFHHYAPTYFGSHYYWFFAEPVVVNADGDSYNISLIYGGNNGGPGGVGGGITGPIRVDGPVNQATVIVTNLFDGPQRWTSTDENGQYSITDLAYGTYRLWADYEGMLCTPVEFTISEENPHVEFTLNMGSEITLIPGLKKASFQSELYPNPAHSVANLDLNLSSSASLQVQILNMTGQAVYTQSVHATSGLQSLQLPTAGLPTGLYLVSVRDAETGVAIGTRRLLVSHE